jgi:hypothetical protein
LLFDDCIISGLSLYTPSLLLVLAYRTHDDNNNPIPVTVKTTPRRGVHHRQTGLSPELRLINVITKEEADADTLTISRFESLSASDYHLGSLYVPATPVSGPVPRGMLGAFSEGLWDASLSGLGGAAKIFSSGASVRSASGSGDNTLVSQAPGSAGIGRASIPGRTYRDLHPTASTPGLKVFIQSPYDCVLAVKRDLSDHLSWLLDHEKYKDAWELVEEHPEVITSAHIDSSSGFDSPSSASTPTKRRESLADFFADESGSQTTISASRVQNSAVNTERRRIGELWLQQLVGAQEWKTAGQVAGRVLGTSLRWQHWILAFAKAGRFDEITPYIPPKRLQPPVETFAYEVVLGHYIKRDCLRLKELLEAWDLDLFKISVITSAIEDRLSGGDVTEDSIEAGEQGRDWRILMGSLAKLYSVDGRAKDALRCYIRIQDADKAMELIRESHLLATISDDLAGFLLLRISKEQLQLAPLSELEEASQEAIHLLVDEAYQGTVRPGTVVHQLESEGSSLQPFLFFYFCALWKGQGTAVESESVSNRKHQQRMAAEGRLLVEEHGDLAVILFAEYDRLLLMEFLRQSRSYAFEKASAVCEQRQYWPELVYLLSQTGETKRALNLIINRLGDVSLAISFAKEQNDPDLWNDLLDYSMDKPRFIRGLLEEVGTAINPITLVKRIPEGLEIEGLREGIGKMVREYEIQASISDGVAKVLRGEVAGGMDALRKGRAKGVKFEVVHEKDKAVEIFVEPVGPTNAEEAAALPVQEEVKPSAGEELKPGYCAGCVKIFTEDGMFPSLSLNTFYCSANLVVEKETLIGFACGHVYHLSCLLDSIKDEDPNTTAAAERLQSQLAADADDGGYNRSVGAKVAHAHIIRNAVRGGCVRCKNVEDN